MSVPYGLLALYLFLFSMASWPYIFSLWPPGLSVPYGLLALYLFLMASWPICSLWPPGLLFLTASWPYIFSLRPWFGDSCPLGLLLLSIAYNRVVLTVLVLNRTRRDTHLAHLPLQLLLLVLLLSPDNFVIAHLAHLPLQLLLLLGASRASITAAPAASRRI